MNPGCRAISSMSWMICFFDRFGCEVMVGLSVEVTRPFRVFAGASRIVRDTWRVCFLEEWNAVISVFLELVGRQGEMSLGMVRLRTHFERSEVLVPFPVRDFGIGLDPEAELIQVRDRDAPIRHPLYQMLPELCREVCPLFQPEHLPTEYHLPEFLSEPLCLLRIVCGSKAFGEFKKGLLLLFLRFEPLF